MKKTLLFMAIFGLVACAPQVAVKKETASGRAEATFKSVDITTVQSALANNCLNKKMNVSTEHNALLCTRQFDPTDPSTGWIKLLFVGNAYSSTPEAVTKYTMIPSDNNVRVVVDVWLQSTLRTGYVDKMSLNDNHEVQNKAQEFLDKKVIELQATARAK